MLDVACAIILRADGTAMAARRGPTMRLPGLWEFPGGKLEPGECSAGALMREIEEELRVRIRLLRELPPVDHHYADFSIRLHPWICEIAQGEPEPMEHAEIRWVNAAALPDLDWAAADLPVLEALLELARSPGENPDLRRLIGR
ncbi:MAG: (deoxy)nucleoside triphosphate pyrophosphohydrolase [Verrucomicrobiales bacterium]